MVNNYYQSFRFCPLKLKPKLTQLFPLKEMENLNDTERVKAEEYWARMQEEGKTNDGND